MAAIMSGFRCLHSNNRITSLAKTVGIFIGLGGAIQEFGRFEAPVLLRRNRFLLSVPRTVCISPATLAGPVLLQTSVADACLTGHDPLKPSKNACLVLL